MESRFISVDVGMFALAFVFGFSMAALWNLVLKPVVHFFVSSASSAFGESGCDDDCFFSVGVQQCAW